MKHTSDNRFNQIFQMHLEHVPCLLCQPVKFWQRAGGACFAQVSMGAMSPGTPAATAGACVACTLGSTGRLNTRSFTTCSRQGAACQC